MEEVITLTRTFIFYTLSTLFLGIVFLFIELAKGKTNFDKRTTIHGGSWYSFGLFIWFITLSIFISQRIALLISGFINTPKDSPWSEVIIGLSSQLGMLTFIALIVAFAPRLIGRPINEESSRRLPSLLWGVFSFFTALPLVWLTSLVWGGFILVLKTLGYEIEIKRQMLVELFSNSPSLTFTITIFAFAVIVAPITEELIFRAGIYRFLKSKGHPYMALALSSLLFAVVHFNLTSFLPLFLLGMLLARSYERTGNILTPIAFHAVFNLNTLILILIAPDLTLLNS